MKQYECEFRVDGTKTTQRIGAMNKSDAKKLIKKAYPNSKVTDIKCDEVKEEKK